MTIQLPLGIVTHTMRVKSLYKLALRTLECYYDRRPAYRYQAVLMRQRFEQNRCLCLTEGQELVKKGEEEAFLKQHWNPRKFPFSPGGSSYERKVVPPDWVLDYWYPLEKAQYPEYFARREKRKEEYIKMWDEKYKNKDKC